MTHDLDFSMAAVQYLKHDLVFDVMVTNYQSVVAGISISPVGVVTREAETASYKFGRSTYAEKGVDDFIDTQQYHLRLCATKYNATKKKREVVAYKDSDYQGFNDAIAAKDCDIMVEFNRCFVERTQDADGTEHFKTMDSTNKTSGALSPAFTRGSKTYTAIRIGKYPVNSSYMSMPNTTPLTGVTLDQMRSAARAKGQYVLDYATYCTLLMLMTVKYGSIDVRNTVGVGSATATSSETATVTSTGTVTCSSATEAQLNAAWSTIRSDTDYKAAVAAAQTKAATKASDTTYDKHASSSKSFSIQIVSNVAMNTIPTSDLEYNWMNSHSLRTKTGAFGTAATSYDTYAKYAKAVADAQAKAAVKASDTTYDKSATSTDIATLPVPAIRYITNKLKYLKKLAYDKDVPWALYPGELDTAVALTTNKTWSVATEDVDAYPREDQIVVVNGGDATDQTGLLYWDRVPTNFTGAQAYFMELVD